MDLRADKLIEVLGDLEEDAQYQSGDYVMSWHHIVSTLESKGFANIVEANKEIIRR